MRKTSKVALAAAGSAVAVAVGAGAVSAAPAPPPHTAKDVVVRTGSSTTISPTGGVWTTIASVTLPAGKWVVSYHATVVNFAASDYVRCTAFTGSTDQGGAASLIGDPDAAGAHGAGALVATVSNAAAFASSTSTAVSLRCEHDHTIASGGPYVDSGASLVAHKGTVLATYVQ